MNEYEVCLERCCQYKTGVRVEKLLSLLLLQAQNGLSWVKYASQNLTPF